MSAVGIHSDQWLLIDTEISRLKRTYFPNIKPLKVEFKSTNIRSYGGPHPRWPFSILEPGQIQNLVEELYSIYDSFQVPLFTVVINKAEHKQKYIKMGHRPDPPYQLAFRFLVERIDWYLENKNRGKSLQNCEFGFIILDEYVGQYNVYHRFRYDKPGYPYYQPIKPYFYRENGRLWGYGLKVFPDRKALPEEL
jgi:hypothetical protein